MLKYTLAGLLLSSIILSSYAQQGSIFGEVIDEIDSTALPFVSVIIYEYQSDKIVDYTQTDEAGRFKINYPALSVLTLKTSRLGYKPYQKDIVVGTDQSKSINLTIALTSKATELAEVMVQGPIIIKEDTVIYNIEHYTEARNETLEGVLANLPGFKVNGDGSIEVNGRKIQKVVVNGEELSDAGSAIITRSLAPGDVESVELRTNEKNSKLKESLLDATEYVVLDIKLKDELKQSIFGKAWGTLGYQNEVEPGGYLNGFSLKKKTKFHLFAEHDRFGEQTISLQQIKNIGAEAFQKMFEIPADFQVLTQREEFDKELFGFNNYTRSWKDIIGVSSKHTVNDAFDIYFGSYNTYDNNRKQRAYTQSFTSGEENALHENEQQEDYTTKNKIDFRFDTEKVKIKLDLNAVLFENNKKNQNVIPQTNRFYQFNQTHSSESFYQNLNMEFVPGKKTGVFLKSAISWVNSDQVRSLNHNDPLYDAVFADESGNPILNIQQEIENDASNFLIEPGLMIKSKIGSFFSGFLYQRKQLSTEKTTFNRDSETNGGLTDFEGVSHGLLYKNLGPFLQHQVSLGKIAFTNKVRFAMLHYPSGQKTQASQNIIEYDLGMTMDNLAIDYISAKFSKKASSFPLEKITRGREIADFQTITIPNEFMLSPQPEYTIELIMSEHIQSAKLLVDGAAVYGQVRNADQYLENQDIIISIQQEQLASEYWLLSLPLTKTFRKIPLKIILEPEILINQNQNQSEDGENYLTRTTRYLAGLKLNTELEKTYNLFVYPKYSSFVFENELTGTRSSQEMLSFDTEVKLDFLDKRLLITPSLRTVRFLENMNSTFTNISFRADYKTSTINWYLTIDNLLNDSNFIRQTIFPTFFISEQNFVFSRYVKIGIEYKFK